MIEFAKVIGICGGTAIGLVLLGITAAFAGAMLISGVTSLVHIIAG